MDNITLKKTITDILAPFGFKKEGTNSWIRKAEEISLKVYLQKSSFSKLYYFNDYYIINKMHINSSGENECFGDIKYSDYKLLSKMCDLESNVSDNERVIILRNLISKDFSSHRYIETDRSGDGSLTHFFVEPLNDSIAYTCESSQLTNPNPIYKGRLKNHITILTLECLNLTDIRKTTKLS